MLPDSGCFFYVSLRNFVWEIGELAPKIDPLAHASSLTPACAISIYVKLVANFQEMWKGFFSFLFHDSSFSPSLY